MGPHARSFRRRPLALLLLCTAVFTPALSTRPAHAASGVEELAPTAEMLASMEQRAVTAEPRERCYLYSELLHGWTELASRSMIEGNDVALAMAIAHADADAVQLKAALAHDSKRLKNAELLLEHTARHLSDMVRVASMDQHDTMQGVLKHLNSVHDALLAQIFAH